MARILKESTPRDRVVITGMGVIAPNGQDLDTFGTASGTESVPLLL